MKTTKALPSDATFLESLPEPRPIMCTRQELPKLFPGRTARTWANMAHRKEGPRFFRKGKQTWYLVSEVIEDICQNPIQTSNGRNSES